MNLDQGYFDISPLISEKIAIFPGDTPYQRKLSLDMNKGNSLTLSSIQSTVHLGAHTDAPNHYHREGEGINHRSLEFYFGPCQVITVSIPRNQRIGVPELGTRKILAPRVLFKTQSFPDPNQWNSDFNSVSPELIDTLGKKGVILIGIDTPSIDPAVDQDLPAHAAVWRNQMAILEGITLEKVHDGVYTLVALPLRLKDADASPVRAILINR